MLSFRGVKVHISFSLLKSRKPSFLAVAAGVSPAPSSDQLVFRQTKKKKKKKEKKKK